MAKLVAHPLVIGKLSGFESRHPSKIINGRHKPTHYPPKNVQNKLCFVHHDYFGNPDETIFLLGVGSSIFLYGPDPFFLSGTRTFPQNFFLKKGFIFSSVLCFYAKSKTTQFFAHLCPFFGSRSEYLQLGKGHTKKISHV